MKKLYTLIFALAPFSCFSQITFTRSDYGMPGDKVLYAVDSPVTKPVNFGAAGTNRSWYFTKGNNSTKRYDSTLFLAASVHPTAPAVVTNLLTRSYAGGDQYQEVQDSFIKIILDFPQYKLLGVKLRLCNLPLVYQASSADSTNVTTKGTFAEFGLPPFPGFDSVRVDAKIRVSSHCDSWGTLTLPDTTSYNTLRVTTNNNVDAEVFVHSPLGWSLFTTTRQYTGNYLWFAPGSKNYIANVGLDTSGNYASFTYRISQVPYSATSDVGSITPDNALQGSQVTVTVKGINTHFTHGAADFSVPGSYFTVNNIQVINDTTLTATLNIAIQTPPGFYSYRITDPLAGMLYSSSSFEVVASPLGPKLVSISPGFGAKGQTIDAVIKGANTHFSQGAAIGFSPVGTSNGRIFIQSFSIVNDSQINCRIHIEPSVSVPAFRVNLSSAADGSMTLVQNFSVVNTGITETDQISGLQIYPNPNNKRFTLTFSVKEKQNASVSIRNTLGQLVYDETLNDLSGGYTRNISLEHLPAGLYFISVSGNEQTRLLKMMTH